MHDDKPEDGTSRNGTQDDPASLWHSTDWAEQERNVRRLRQRIFKAAQEGDLKKVRNLQKLMLRSHSNTLLSVRRVTQQSAGKRTAGVDGHRALTPKDRGLMVIEFDAIGPPRPKPVKRVYIPKANGKMRPLGIPVIRDRVQQARVKNALEPEWEAKFEARSYGFRPGLGCHDALSMIYNSLKGGKIRTPRRPWILDADLAGAFDAITHEHLMDSIGTFPAREAIRRWLKAGMIENGTFAKTVEGTPQGGVISPLLLNIALHGMETAAGVKTYVNYLGVLATNQKSPTLVRYADDFVVMCHSEDSAREVKRSLEEWLAPRGLTFNEEKTKISHVTEGFDFLGCTVKRYPNGTTLTTPSKAAMRRARQRIRAIIDEAGSGGSQTDLVLKLTPFVKGWSTYYSPVCASDAFHDLDNYMFERLWKWAVKRHRRKGRRWVKGRYWGQHQPGRKDTWVFGNKATRLPKFSWTKIQRHKAVPGGYSKDDPALAEYWDTRSRKKGMPALERKLIIGLAVRQKGLCPGCGLDLMEGAGFEPDDLREWVNWFSANMRPFNVHHMIHRQHGGSDDPSNLELRHTACHQQLHAGGQDRANARSEWPA